VGLPDGRHEQREKQGDPLKAHEVPLLVAWAEEGLISKVERAEEERGARSEKQPIPRSAISTK